MQAPFQGWSPLFKAIKEIRGIDECGDIIEKHQGVQAARISPSGAIVYVVDDENTIVILPQGKQYEILFTDSSPEEKVIL